MASQKIVGRVLDITRSDNTPDDEAEVIVSYMVTGQGIGQRRGTALIQVNIAQNETQINSDLRALLAAYIDPLVLPQQNFAANDVRGLNM